MFADYGDAIGGPLYAPETSSLPITTPNHQFDESYSTISFIGLVASEHVDFEKIRDSSYSIYCVCV